jgi:ATP-dependent DNA helicase RecQ
MVDATVLAQKALSAIARTGERFATEHLINLLCGEETEAILRFGHNELKTFGVGKEHSKNEWRSLFRQLYAAGIISLDIAGYGRWSITDLGRSVLKGATPFERRREALARSSRETRAARKAARMGIAEGDVDQSLLDALKQQRLGLARAQSVPAYVIFPDRTLIEMARMKPTDTTALASVHGVGEAKLARYGEAFLDVIRRHSS